MSTDSGKFDEILERFGKLSRTEREELIDKLEQHQVPANNGTPSDQSLLDAFQKRGMIGSIKDAPPDWSSNPKYLDGFGQHDQ